MKLSELEALVATMRATATTMGITDPVVEFYDTDVRRPENLTVPANIKPSTLHRCMVNHDGSIAKRGDFSIPLTRT